MDFGDLGVEVVGGNEAQKEGMEEVGDLERAEVAGS